MSFTESDAIRLLSETLIPYAPSAAQPNYQDDCALIALTPPPNLAPELLERTAATSTSILVTTDALCEGIHFDLEWDSYEEIGAQAAIVNLSDLASSGGRATALLWSLSLPNTLTATDLRALASGFGSVASAWQCPVVGDNLCVRSGRLEIHVTAIGLAPAQKINRSQAQPGDLVYVTGHLGERALGYLDPTPETRKRRHQWRPHLAEAQSLVQWGHVTAMLDISDGLLLDAERLARASGVTLLLSRSDLPLSTFARAHPLGASAALTGGEDYVLLFTAPPGVTPPHEAQATCIGSCQTWSAGQSFIFLDGIPQKGEGHTYQINP